MKGYMYILQCDDGSYYTGSTIDLLRRFKQHLQGLGANYTRKHPPVGIVYFETFDRIDKAFKREKQVQGWSRAKKQALIYGKEELLPQLSKRKKKKMSEEEQERAEIENWLDLRSLD